jgi:hypothetical protein
MKMKSGKPGTAMPKRATAQDFHDWIVQLAKSKEDKVAADAYASAVGALVAHFGKQAAMGIHAKAGLIITHSKDEALKS